jgi:ABC-type uncharacterized transport system ATPase subunit
MSQARIVGLGRVSELKAQLEQEVNLELFLKPEVAAAAEQVLETMREARRLQPYQWRVTVERAGGEAAIHHILSLVKLERLEDFRVHTASLEDVYMKLTGHTISSEENAQP